VIRLGFQVNTLPRRVFIGLGALCLLLLGSCKHQESSALRIGLATAPVTLDPRFATDATSSRINRLLYRRLVDFDAQLQPIPDLATWEKISLTQYRFHLQNKDGRQFHDGTPLTANDVKATYEFVLTAANASPHRAAISHIQQIKIIDDNTLDFILSKPDNLFIGRLTIGIVPQRVQATSLQRNALGSGNFRLLAWEQASHLQLQRLRDQRVFDFLEVKDPVIRALKLLRGEIDLTQEDLSPELVGWLSKQENIQVTRQSGDTFTYLGFNLQDELTGKLLFRQAVAYALDRKAIIHYVLGDGARLASSILPPEHWAGNPELGQYEYNPGKARQLLAQLGISPEHPVNLVYKTSSNPFRIRLVTVMQQQLLGLGIHLEIRSYDWGTFYGDIKAGRFQVFSLSWIGVKSPDIFRYAFHSSALPPTGANRGRLQRPEVDNLIEAAENAQALPEQVQAYRILQAYLFEQLPYVPLWYENNVVAMRARVQNYRLNREGNYDGLQGVGW